MKKSDFHYELPPELIAQAPLPERSASRLLHVPPGAAAFTLPPYSLVEVTAAGPGPVTPLSRTASSRVMFG